MLLVEGIKLEAGMAFQKRADTQTYMVTSVRNDNTVLIATKSPNGISKQGKQWDSSTIQKVSYDAFLDRFSTFVELPSSGQ